MDMSKYKAMFISETQEHLQSMNQGLLAIEQNPADQDAVAEVFRNAHSIKGMAASMGYEPVRDLAHAMEDLMDDVREGTRQADARAMELLFKGLDTLDSMVEDVEQDREISGAGLELAKEIRDFRGQETAPTQPGPATEAEPPQAEAPETGEDKPESGDFPQLPDEGELEDTGSFRGAPLADMEMDPGPSPDAQAPPPKPGFEFSLDEPKEAAKPAEKPPTRPDDIELDVGEVAPRRSLLKKPKEKSRPPEPKPSEAPPEPDTISIEDMIGEETAGPAPPPPAPGPAPAPAEEQAAGKKPNRRVRVVFSSQTASPGVRGLILFKRLDEVGEVLGSRPGRDDVKAGNFMADPKGLAVEVDLVSEASESDIIKVIKSLTDVQSFEVTVPSAGPAPAEAGIDDTVIKESGRIEQGYDPFAQVQALPQTVRVRTTVLDRFINALGEMILVKSELREVAKRNPSSALESGLDRLEALVKDFNEQVMSIRLMALETVVQRLPRVVRDLAKEEGKKVRFEVKGQDIELDRAILEQLSDPLIHLLRNCVSHAIEPAEERAKLGKPEQGSITLEAYRLRDMILIDVKDDGCGIDPFAVKEAALAKGLVSHEEVASMSDDEVYQLIFQPGFSTAKKVGMVSGRGVGMDVVKNVVENVGGYVTVRTKVGAGTTFTLHLPRTIAIVNVLLIRLAGEIFAIPISKILKTVEILPHQVRKTQGNDFYLDRQELVPMKALHRFVDLKDERKPGALSALIVETHNKKTALLVDDLVGQEEAFIRPLGKPLERISGLSGVTMLGDGRVVFVLDTMGLL